MGARRAKAAIVFFCLLRLDFSRASQAPPTPKRPEESSGDLAFEHRGERQASGRMRG